MMIEFYQAKMKKGSELSDHIGHMNELVAALRLSGHEIEEFDRKAILLHSLPEDFDPTVAHLENLFDVLSVEQMNSQLMAREAKVKSKTIVPSGNVAFQAEQDSGCWFCGEKGHKKRDCPKLKNSKPKSQNNQQKRNQPKKKEGNKGGNNGGHKNQEPRRRPEQAHAAQAEESGSEGAVEFGYFCFIPSHVCLYAQQNKSNWICDSGASVSVTYHRHSLKNFCELKVPIPIRLGNDGVVYAVGRGSVNIVLQNGQLKLDNVLYVPDFKVHILSLTAMRDQGIAWRSEKHASELEFLHGGKLLGIANRRKGGLFMIEKRSGNCGDGAGDDVAYAVNHKQLALTHETVFSCKVDVNLMHQRLGHTNTQTIEKMSASTKYDFNVVGKKSFCDGCVQGKIAQTPHRKHEIRSTKPLQRLFVDLVGPVTTGFVHKYKYFMTVVDDYSRFCFAEPLKAKSDAADQLSELILKLQRQLDRSVVAVLTDGGVEFLNSTLSSFYAKHGITQEVTVRDSPEQNTAERYNRVLIEAGTSMLVHANLDKADFWPWAVRCAAYIRNRVYSRAIDATPFELFFDKMPSYENLRVFGCVCWSHVPKEKRGKFEPKAEKMLFMGYPQNTKAWILYDPITRKFVVRNDVVFDEESFQSRKNVTFESSKFRLEKVGENGENNGVKITEIVELEDQDRAVVPVQNLEGNPPNIEITPATPARQTTPVRNDTPENQPMETPLSAVSRMYNSARSSFRRMLTPRRSIRESIPNERFGFDAQGRATTIVGNSMNYMEKELLCHAVGDQALTYKEAMESPERDEYMKAMQAELASMEENQVWKTVPTPPDRKIVGSKWLFSVKRNKDGAIARYKARLVARGFTQVYGVDWFESYSPVVKATTIRTLCALSVIYKLQLAVMDCVTAFLNSPIDTEIYMKPPEGVEVPKGSCLQLVKSLYGLVQSPLLWNQTLKKRLLEIGFKVSAFDSCLYKINRDGQFGYMTVYVDDCIIASSSRELCEYIKREVAKAFKIKDLGTPTYCLGISFECSEDRVVLHQERYINVMLERFGMVHCGTVDTPSNSTVDLNEYENDAPVDKTLYQRYVGSLLYCSICTRPDITFAVSCLARYQQDPRTCHLTAAKRVLRYLKGTAKFGLNYGVRTNNRIQCFSDASYASCTNTRRSTSGYIVLLAGAPISWDSKRQTVTATSTCEAEFVALASATSEVIWLKGLIGDIGLGSNDPVTIFTDSQNAQSFCLNPIVSRRTKHIDVKLHFVKDYIALGTIKLVWVGTDEQLADYLTKALPRDKLEKLRAGSGVVPFGKI